MGKLPAASPVDLSFDNTAGDVRSGSLLTGLLPGRLFSLIPSGGSEVDWAEAAMARIVVS